MKLFQKMLVAGTALSFIAPVASQASETLNLEEMNSYVRSEKTSQRFDSNSFINDVKEDLAKVNSRIDGLEAKQNNFEAGGFSDTTVLDGKAVFDVGSVDTDDDTYTGQAQFMYTYTMNLNTSFTGEDSLDISLDAGNANGPLAEFDFNGPDESLTVDGVSYTFPIGDSITAIVGDNTDGSALFTTACAYGGPSNTLDDCGNVNAGITNGGFMVGAAYDFENGWTAALGYAGPETDIMSKEGADAWGGNVAYTADNYGFSVTYGHVDSTAGTPAVPDGEKDAYTAFNAYYSFDNGLSISGGYEFGDIGGALATADESINYFIGINGEVGPGELGAGMHTSGGQIEGQDEELMYEAYYSYPLNDGMTITPGVYVREQDGDDQTGFAIKTSFSF